MTETILRWAPLLLTISQLVMAWFLWSLRQQFISRADCKDCRKELAGSDQDSSSKIEGLALGVGALPTRPEFKDLGDKIGALTAKIGHLDGRLTGINRAVDLLNQHHLRVNQ